MYDETKPLRDGIAANLTRVMRRRRVSARRLAERSPLGLDHIQAFLGGTADPRVDELFLLAAALEVEPAVLLERIEWIPDGCGGGCFRIRERAE